MSDSANTLLFLALLLASIVASAILWNVTSPTLAFAAPIVVGAVSYFMSMRKPNMRSVAVCVLLTQSALMGLLMAAGS